MSVRILNERDYYRIVYGGWMGKNIGGTLGYKDEGNKDLLGLTYYPVLPDGPLENDDLDLQLVCLHALEQYGPGLTSRELGQEWLEHVFFPFDEYGYALTNLRRGLLPPVAGAFNNPFVDCMGAPIRSEIWGMAAPGMPGRAAYYAYQDATVDHAGGEGVYGEMFFAAIASAIFFEKNRDRLIEIGLRYIPEHCRVYQAVKDLIAWHGEGKSWTEARSLIIRRHGRDNFTDAPQNIAFTILGWLYGQHFEDAILKAVNCGYDTDCTAATLGAILGMLAGAEELPAKWVDPIGDKVAVSPAVKGFNAPYDLDELTRRTIRMGKQVLAAWDSGILVHPELPTSLDEYGIGEITEIQEVQKLWERPSTRNHYLLPYGSAYHSDLELIIEFGQEGPAIGPGQSKRLNLTLVNRSRIPLAGSLSLSVPFGWRGPDARAVRLEPGESIDWTVDVVASADLAAFHELHCCWTRNHDGHYWAEQRVRFTLTGAYRWTISGPGGAEEVETSFAGNRIEWEKSLGVATDGEYRARTRLYNPSERMIRLIAAANGPVTMKLNGQTLVECRSTLEFMPAYHRAPPEQVAELSLAAGVHDLEIVATRQGEPLLVYFLTTSVKETLDPGSYYSYTDIKLS